MPQKTKIAYVFLLCIVMVIGSLSALAQKPDPASTDKINLNSASAEQLESLPGIGPVTAKRIVDYRAKIGKFKQIEEIINIEGIGEKKFERIKDRLTIQ